MDTHSRFETGTTNPRFPIQISTTTVPGIVIYTVLCSDATIWTSHDLGLNWVLLAPIPQPKKIDITIGGD